MVYANMVLAHGGAAEFAGPGGASGVAGAIVPDLPLGEAEEVAPPSPPRAWRSCRWSRRRRAGAPPGDRRRRGRLHLPRLDLGTTGERAEVPRSWPSSPPATKADAGETPVAVGFGISTAAQAAEVGRIADGVIIGSRLVRAAGEGGIARPAADAVGEFLAETRVSLAR